jgi:hypothetical protein
MRPNLRNLSRPYWSESGFRTVLAQHESTGPQPWFVCAKLLQFPHHGWAALSGIVTVALGVFLWAQWPTSANWFIGLAVGINFIFAGIAWSATALKLESA